MIIGNEHPEWQKLIDRYNQRYEQLEHLLWEYEELRLIICRKIEYQYQLEFGALELDCYIAEGLIDRANKKIQLIKHNQTGQINMEMIDYLLDQENSEQLDEIEKRTDKLRADLKEASLLAYISNQDKEEMEVIYHQCLRILHPDLNPEATPSDIHLLLELSQYYQNGDLTKGKQVLERLAKRLDEKRNLTSQNELLEGLTMVNDRIGSVQVAIDRIKRSYPYNKKELVESQEKAESYFLNLSERLLTQRKELRKLKETLASLTLQEKKEHDK